MKHLKTPLIIASIGWVLYAVHLLVLDWQTFSYLNILNKIN